MNSLQQAASIPEKCLNEYLIRKILPQTMHYHQFTAVGTHQVANKPRHH